MTYNTTREALERLAGERLFKLRPDLGIEGLEHDEFPREILLSAEVHDFVNVDFDGSDDVAASLRALMDGIVSGDYVTLAQKPYEKDRDAVFARVYPVEREVWDIRSLAPWPGARVLGFFAEVDVFVGLTFAYRDEIDWDEERDRCSAMWRELFGSLPPHKGEKYDDFISYNSASA